MKRIFALSSGRLFLFIPLLLIIGCTSAGGVIDVQAVDAQSPISVAKKAPLNVGIFISEEDYSAIVTPRPKGGHVIPSPMSIPFGKILKKKSLDVFPNFFEEVILTKVPSDLPGIDAIITPSIVDFRFEKSDTTGFGFFTSRRIDASITAKVTMTDLKGKPIWERTIQSPKILGQVIRVIDESKFQHIAVGGTVSKAVAAALQDAAREMIVSGEVRNYAVNKNESKKIASSQSQKALPTIKSDVDKLPSFKARQNKNAYAIVIGVEKYRQKLPRADFADNDARIMAEYLAKVMGYPEENIVMLINDHAAKSDFEKYLGKWLPNNVEKDSSVFIYYSGHGAPNPKTGEAYLVPYDGDPSFIEETGYPLKRLYAKLDRLQVKEIIVVLDSCFSGAGGRSVLAKGARPLVMNIDNQVFHSDRIAILTASAGNQISSTYEEKGHGLFTYFFLKGIKAGNSELGTLYNYLKPQVENVARKKYNNEQTPQLIAPNKTIMVR